MTHTLDICLASNKPENLDAFLSHHVGNDDGVHFYMIVDDEACRSVAAEYCSFSTNNSQVTVIENPCPELKYYGLNHGYQAAFEQSDGEFFTIVTDEIRYPEGWYERLQSEFDKYLLAYPDRIFRLRVSDFRHKNYHGLMQCMTEPENYSICTREWLTIADGVGEFWGPDSWHQCIEYLMGVMHDKFFPHGLRRGFPLEFFNIQGMDAGVGVEGEKRKERDKRIRAGWTKFVQREYQQHYLLMAYKLRMQVFANQMKCPIGMEADEGHGVYKITSNGVNIGMLNARIPDIAVKVFDGFCETGEMLLNKPVFSEELLRP